MKKMVTLVVATTADPASINPATALVALAPKSWLPGTPFHGYENFSMGNVRLLQLTGSIVGEDHLDKRWKSHTGELVKEIIFMSKHVAASNMPALTVHPIGIPHMKPDEKPLQGGRPGWAAPPCPRIGPWLGLVKEVAAEHKLLPEFEVTFEATHHGPEVDAPAMFVEIGSTEEYWKRQDAADVIAKVFWKGLGLDGGSGVGNWTESQKGERVLLGIGGGHYVPRHMDMLKKTGCCWVGHLLSNYSIPMEDPASRPGKNNEDPSVKGQETWKHAIREAFDTTVAAFPGGRVIANLDAKSLKSWQRNAIVSFLESENIPVARKAEEFK